VYCRPWQTSLHTYAISGSGIWNLVMSEVRLPLSMCSMRIHLKAKGCVRGGGVGGAERRRTDDRCGDKSRCTEQCSSAPCTGNITSRSEGGCAPVKGPVPAFSHQPNLVHQRQHVGRRRYLQIRFRVAAYTFRSESAPTFIFLTATLHVLRTTLNPKSSSSASPLPDSARLGSYTALYTVPLAP
jgi:hypothetical protein